MPETDDDRTVRFNLTNPIQMWRQTLNQDAFRRKHTFSNEIEERNALVLGKGAHCIVKMEKFSNSSIMEWFDSKLFRLQLKYKLQDALVSPEIECLEGEGDCSGEILKKKA
ncbi:hypothetical protein T07_6852 [Trichinella nelsoni]|uniref:Uncharacterized protein n=1 Tax=Trichinella nelsoni TaxID=6336 RepID=A0A0V0RZC2_9BILA|nr:hypothetical protein T07_6852 [Trichinella nelsoni]